MLIILQIEIIQLQKRLFKFYREAIQIKYSFLTNKRVYPKRCSLKCEELRTNKSAFSRILGEGGAKRRMRGGEVCTA